MEMRPVTSSQIHSIGHDPETQTLRIQFKDRTNKKGETIPGGVYEYTDVPDHVHAGLLAADADEKQSVGGHFRQRVIGGGFAYRRIS